MYNFKVTYLAIKPRALFAILWTLNSRVPWYVKSTSALNEKDTTFAISAGRVVGRLPSASAVFLDPLSEGAEVCPGSVPGSAADCCVGVSSVTWPYMNWTYCEITYAS